MIKKVNEKGNKKTIGKGAIMPGAEPFFYPVGGEAGCLLVHGFSGSPHGMKRMGQYLAGAGISALGVRLHGHGTKIEEMERCHYREWIASAEEGLIELHRHCRLTFVAGISMGGVLALHLARYYPDQVNGVIAMCTPYDMPLWMKFLAPPLKYLVKRVAPPKGVGTKKPSVAKVGYRQFSLPAVHQLIRLVNEVRPELPFITCPALVIASRRDLVVRAGNAPRILNALGSKKKELFWVENSGHMITLDYDRDQVFQRAENFIKKEASI